MTSANTRFFHITSHFQVPKERNLGELPLNPLQGFSPLSLEHASHIFPAHLRWDSATWSFKHGLTLVTGICNAE